MGRDDRRRRGVRATCRPTSPRPYRERRIRGGATRLSSEVERWCQVRRDAPQARGPSARLSAPSTAGGVPGARASRHTTRDGAP